VRILISIILISINVLNEFWVRHRVKIEEQLATGRSSQIAKHDASLMSKQVTQSLLLLPFV